MGERWVFERLSPVELLREETWHVVACCVDDRPSLGLERLHQYAARCVAAAPARELGDQLERPLLGPEVRQAEARVDVDDRGELDTLKVMPLRDHLRPEQHRALRFREARERCGELL